MEDLVQVLTEFHRDVVLPDIKRVVGDLRDEMNARFTSLDGDFDAIYQRFDKLETEFSNRSTFSRHASGSRNPTTRRRGHEGRSGPRRSPPSP